MRKSVALGVIAALGLSGQAFAAEGFSYNLLEASYSNVELDGTSADGDVLGIGGSVEFTQNFFGFASLADGNYDAGVDTFQTTLGLGYALPLNTNLDLVVGASYERYKVKAPVLGSDTENGYGLNLGLRGRVGEQLELNGGLKYIDLGGGADDTTFNVGARYYFTPAFAAGVDVSTNDDGTTYGLAVRYDFGNRF